MDNIKNGRTISIMSAKGGVGKTIFTTNLAATYSKMGKKVLIIDFDLFGGGIATYLNIKFKNDIYNLIDDLNNNRFEKFDNYISKYNKNIDIIACPRDPRQASKTNTRNINIIINKAKLRYDVVLLDVSHVINKINLSVLDSSNKSVFLFTSDPLDLKNMKSLISVVKDSNKNDFITILNNSVNCKKKFVSNYEIANLFKNKINYEIPSNFFVKYIDKYTIKGEILVTNKWIKFSRNYAIKIFRKIADNLLKEGNR